MYVMDDRFEDLARRYEIPNAKQRWDKPLFVVRLEEQINEREAHLQNELTAGEVDSITGSHTSKVDVEELPIVRATPSVIEEEYEGLYICGADIPCNTILDFLLSKKSEPTLNMATIPVSLNI